MNQFQARGRVAFFLAALFFAAYFFWFAWDGLYADFTHDDLMNGWRGWFRSWPDHLKDMVLFFRVSPTYRPFGNAVYKFFFTLSGLHLFWMRVFCLGTILTGTFLVYAIARRLTGSREAGALAALMQVYHSNFSHLYYNNGNCYDIFCFFFYFAAFLYYLRAHQSGRYLRVHEVAVVCCLLILGLNSKEMAATLPAMIFFYEVLYHPPARLAPAELGRWLLRACAVPAVTGVIVVAFVFGRIVSPGGISHVGGYTMTVSLSEYLKHTGGYLGELFYQPHWFSPAKVAMFLLALLAVAWRSAPLLFCWLFFTLSILPIAFVPARALGAICIPMVGLVIYGGVLLVRGRDLVLSVGRSMVNRPPPKSPGASPKVLGLYGRKQFALFIALALVLSRTHARHPVSLEPWGAEQGRIRGVMEDWGRLHPVIPKRSRILILKDPFILKEPFGGFHWASVFIAHLVHRDSTLIVDRLSMLNPKPDGKKMAEYNYILTWEDGHLRDVAIP